MVKESNINLKLSFYFFGSSGSFSASAPHANTYEDKIKASEIGIAYHFVKHNLA